MLHTVRHDRKYLMPSLEHATVATAMHPGIVSCDVDDSLTEVARLMATHHVHCVAVIRPLRDVPSEPHLCGIVSDLDVVRAGLSVDDEPSAGSVATQPPTTVRSDLELRDAAELMVINEVSHLIVIEPRTRRPIGVLSTLDVARVLAWG